MDPMLVDRDLSLWRLFLDAHAALVEKIEADVEEQGALPFDWYNALATVARQPEGSMRLNEMAKALAISRSGVTRLLDEIEEKGYARRQSVPGDRRGLLAVITDEGRDALRKAAPAYSRAVKQSLTSKVGPLELEMMAKALKKVIAEEPASTRTYRPDAPRALRQPNLPLSSYALTERRDRG